MGSLRNGWGPRLQSFFFSIPFSPLASRRRAKSSSARPKPSASPVRKRAQTPSIAQAAAHLVRKPRLGRLLFEARNDRNSDASEFRPGSSPAPNLKSFRSLRRSWKEAQEPPRRVPHQRPRSAGQLAAVARKPRTANISSRPSVGVRTKVRSVVGGTSRRTPLRDRPAIRRKFSPAAHRSLRLIDWRVNRTQCGDGP